MIFKTYNQIINQNKNLKKYIKKEVNNKIKIKKNKEISNIL